MRTTITLDARLLERLKRRAAESGTSVSKVIERAVRLFLEAHAAQQSVGLDLVTFGEGSKFTPLNVDKTAKLIEADDVERFGRQINNHTNAGAIHWEHNVLDSASLRSLRRTDTCDSAQTGPVVGHQDGIAGI